MIDKNKRFPKIGIKTPFGRLYLLNNVSFYKVF